MLTRALGSILATWLLSNAMLSVEIYYKALNDLGPHSLTCSPLEAALPTNSKMSSYITEIKIFPEWPFFSQIQWTHPTTLLTGRAASLQCSGHLEPACYLKTFPALTDFVYVSFLEFASTVFWGLVGLFV